MGSFRSFLRNSIDTLVRRIASGLIDERQKQIADLQKQILFLNREIENLKIESEENTRLLINTPLFQEKTENLRNAVAVERKRSGTELVEVGGSEHFSAELRALVRFGAGLKSEEGVSPSVEYLTKELKFLVAFADTLRPFFKSIASKRVLFVGQAYYNTWYLSRALRNLQWKTDVLNWDHSAESQTYYHGQDYIFDGDPEDELRWYLQFYLSALYEYDVFHFSNAGGISFGGTIQNYFTSQSFELEEISLLKKCGKKIVYSNNGCLDGVSQTAFSKWGPESACSICRWKNEPTVCSDEKNLEWGRYRNSVADFQCLLGGNRVDYNVGSRIHEVPEFYCLDKTFWHPQLEIPEKFRLQHSSKETLVLYHAVGNRKERTNEAGVNIKSSHVYLPLIEQLKLEGYRLELLEPSGIPNQDIRFLQSQSDIFLEMLTFGWFGANAREAMMLGKPVICFIRPEWLESVRREIPEYAEELPIVSATLDTVEAVLRDLIDNPKKRKAIGQRGREFAVKWHSAETGGHLFDHVYSALLKGDPLLGNTVVRGDR